MRDAGPIADYPEARVQLVRVDDRELTVVRWQGTFFASGSRCPHMMAELCHGTVEAALVSDKVGSFDVDATRPVLVCPWHGWQFDLKTGQSLADAKVKMRIFRTTCQDGRLLVDTTGR